jgi:hypothetical protein
MEDGLGSKKRSERVKTASSTGHVEPFRVGKWSGQIGNFGCPTRISSSPSHDDQLHRNFSYFHNSYIKMTARFF